MPVRRGKTAGCELLRNSTVPNEVLNSLALNYIPTLIFEATKGTPQSLTVILAQKVLEFSINFPLKTSWFSATAKEVSSLLSVPIYACAGEVFPLGM